MGSSPTSEDPAHRLHAALHDRDLEAVRLLLAQGADPNTEVDGKTPLDRVVHGADELRIELIVAGAWHPTLTRSLVWAAGTRRADLVRRLVAAGADVNMTAPLGTPLLRAAAHGDLEITRCLLEADADPDAGNMRSVPLSAALVGRHEDVALTLLEAGADSEREGAPALVEAAAHDCGRVVQWLLEHGADVDAVAAVLVIKSSGTTRVAPVVMKESRALHAASRMGHEELVRELLAAGSDPVAPDGDGQRPLECAELGEHADVVSVLEPHDSQPRRATPNQSPPAEAEAEQGNPLIASIVESRWDEVDRLLDGGADPRSRDAQGETPLLAAARRGNAALLRRLIGLGADPNDVDGHGLTALHHAMLATDWIMTLPRPVALARAMGYDPDTPIRSLEVCPTDKILAAIEALLEGGADPSAGGENAPLIGATRYGLVEVATRLIAAGAKLTTAVWRDATNFDQPEILALLSTHGQPPANLDEDEDEYEDEDEEYEEDDGPKWGPPLPAPDLAKAAARPEYIEAVEELGRRCGSRPVPLWPNAGHYEVHVRTRLKSDLDFEALQRRWRERGAFVYQERWRNNKIRILPTTRLRDVLATEGTNGANYEVGTGYIAQWFERLADEHPHVITQVRRDTVAGRFLEPIDDPRALARSIYTLCPDTVDQGFEEFDRLVEHLRTERTFHLWWD